MKKSSDKGKKSLVNYLSLYDMKNAQQEDSYKDFHALILYRILGYKSALLYRDGALLCL